MARAIQNDLDKIIHERMIINEIQIIEHVMNRRNLAREMAIHDTKFQGRIRHISFQVTIMVFP